MIRRLENRGAAIWLAPADCRGAGKRVSRWHQTDHYWLRAQVNGEPANFLIDTGATLTAVSQDVADRAGLQPRAGGLPVTINTANGSVSAELSTIDELRFGNVSARGLDVVIAPSLGQTNVVGMNLLSRLGSLRVEDNVMILTPNNPQPAVEWSAE